jgi:hypothetical protein
VNIKVDVETESVVRLTSEVLRQLPFAANNAITRTANEAVIAAQREAGEHLQIRKNFILRRIKILSYSRTNNLTAVIGVDPNVQGSPLILGFLEAGQSGVKTGSLGEGVAVPLTGSPARPSFPQSVPTSLRYTNLHIANRKGKKSTYVVPGVGVFERIGAGGRKWNRTTQKMITVDRTDTVEIYSFKPSVPLTTHVHLRDAMLNVISQRFAAIFTEEFEKEILARVRHLSG